MARPRPVPALGVLLASLSTPLVAHGWVKPFPERGTARAVVVRPGGVVVAAGAKRFPNSAELVVEAYAEPTGTVLATYRTGGTSVDDGARALALDGNGDLVVAGTVDGQLAAVKLAGATLAEVWRRALGPGDGWAVAVSPAGDVLVGGRLGPDFAVARLAGTDGTETWRYTFPSGISGRALAAAVAWDGAGDATAAGVVGQGLTIHSDFFVVKMAGADGQEVWRHQIDGGDGLNDEADGVAVDAAGDVLASGALSVATAGEPPGTRSVAVVKLGATDGSETWRHTIPAPFLDPPVPLVLTASGDVIAGGADAANPMVVRLAGADGSESWRVHPFGGGGVVSLLLDPAGDVLAAGDPPSDEFAKLSSATGDRLWSFAFAGQAVAVDAAGEPAVASVSDPWVQGLAERVAGARLAMTDRGAPSARTLRLVLKDPRIGTPGPGPDDPTLPTTTLTISNPSTLESVSLPLPAAHWKRVMRAAPFRSLSYFYDDPTRADGPCTRVSIQPGRIKARCAGAGLAFSLDEPTQGTLAVRLAIPTAFRYCTAFGGTVTADAPGRFTASKAPPPAACTP